MSPTAQPATKQVFRVDGNDDRLPGDTAEVPRAALDERGLSFCG